MQKSRFNWISGLFLATLLSVPALAANSAQPGTINYIQGQVSIGNQVLGTNSVGSAQLQPGQSLTTGNGKAEILLTPGVFLRVADNSSLTMVSPDLDNTEVRLAKGRAMVEVAEIHKENNLLVDEDGATTRLMKTGLYDFDADRSQVRVFSGQANTELDNKQVKVKGGHELSLNGQAKPQSFEKASFEDGFYRWSSLRSDYLAEANFDAARSYAVSGSAWMGTGWYWNPWYAAYTFVPGDGMFYSPFGWGFFSPAWAYGIPYYGGYYGRGYHHFNGFAGRVAPYNRGFTAPRGIGVPRGNTGFRGGFQGRSIGGGFRSGGGFHGGGFHGGGVRR